MLNRIRQPGTRGLIFGLLCTALIVSATVSAAGSKQIVGAIEIVEIEPQKLRIKARVDSGAQTSSIHAEDIVIDQNGDPRGKPIAFTVVNEHDQSQRIKAHVDKRVRVKTSEGSESRYAVPITITWKKTSKTVLVTLNDRAQMRHRLLLGRNWLRGDYIVDVELNDED